MPQVPPGEAVAWTRLQVTVKLENASPEQGLQQIAKALDAKLEKTRTGWKLSPK